MRRQLSKVAFVFPGFRCCCGGFVSALLWRPFLLGLSDRDQGAEGRSPGATSGFPPFSQQWEQQTRVLVSDSFELKPNGGAPIGPERPPHTSPHASSGPHVYNAPVEEPSPSGFYPVEVPTAAGTEPHARSQGKRGLDFRSRAF